MAKTRRTKPSFDIAPASEVIDTTWVYRSDDSAAAASAAPAPSARVSAAAPPRSRFETALAWLAMPFGLVLMVALVPLSKRRVL